MTDTSPILVRAMPHGVLASTIVGAAAGALAWLVCGIWPAVTTSYTRLDQWSALTVGAIIGAAVLGARAVRQRGSTAFDAAAGALLGGFGALTGASLLAFGHGAVSPVVFLVERIFTWAFTAALSALGLSGFIHPGTTQRRFVRESVILAALGGGISGILFTLPGASDAWQAVACLWFGATIGFAVGGPELWHADATVAALPPRGRQLGMLALREWPLNDGVGLRLGEAQLACYGGRVALYPPAGGVVVEGRQVREPRFLPPTAIVAVGHARYRVRRLRR